MKAFSIEDLFNKFNYDEDSKSYFEGFSISDSAYVKSNDQLVLKIHNNKVLPIKLYTDLLSYFKDLGFSSVKAFFKVDDDELSLKDIKHYIDYFISLYGAFLNAIVK